MHRSAAPTVPGCGEEVSWGPTPRQGSPPWLPDYEGLPRPQHQHPAGNGRPVVRKRRRRRKRCNWKLIRWEEFINEEWRSYENQRRCKAVKGRRGRNSHKGEWCEEEWGEEGKRILLLVILIIYKKVIHQFFGSLLSWILAWSSVLCGPRLKKTDCNIYPSLAPVKRKWGKEK